METLQRKPQGHYESHDCARHHKKVKEVIPEMMGNYKYINPHSQSVDTENSADATETVTSIIEP